MKSYAVKEIFLTLQGEGTRAGTAALFVRFAGCNLWNGLPADREKGAGPCAKWCDTDFAKGKPLGADALIAEMDRLWESDSEKWCVLTGGEPCLQIDHALITALHNQGWRVAIETNGTIRNQAVALCDWVCVAPKRGTEWWAIGLADEIKVVLPGADDEASGWTDTELLAMASESGIALRRGDSSPVLFVQPQDPILDPSFVEQTALKRTIQASDERALALASEVSANTKRCIDWVRKHSNWRLGLQTHKALGLR